MRKAKRNFKEKLHTLLIFFGNKIPSKEALTQM